MRFSDDAGGFVSIGEAVPDVILEIRYYSTFNFIGDSKNRPSVFPGHLA